MTDLFKRLACGVVTDIPVKHVGPDHESRVYPAVDNRTDPPQVRTVDGEWIPLSAAYKIVRNGEIIGWGRI